MGERLREMGVNAEVCESDPLAMIERWNPPDDVIIVDAMVTGAPVGTVQYWDEPARAKWSAASSSTHGLAVGEAIRLAEILGRLPRRVQLCGIEGKQFQTGAGVSPKVQQAIENVAQRIAAEIVRAAEISAG